MRRLSLFATASALALAPFAPQALAASNCSPSTVMVLFDRSTSMTETIGTETKWDIATSALEDVVGVYQSQAAFGLTLFPDTQFSCAGGVMPVDVAPALNTLPPITSTLSASPQRNMWTPIGQTLKQVPSMAGMADTSKRRFVILVTDGREDCPSASDIMSTPAMVSVVKSLKTSGITTYVIGFGENTVGDGVDAYALNQLAYYGGTGPSGCDAAGNDPTSAKNCYYQADNKDALAAALDEIALQISTEVCDGLDNNCNGQIDENLTRPCSTTCGTGTEHCDMGKWVGCTAPPPATNMCTNMPTCDPPPTFCGCTNGDTQPCGPPDRGECKPGTSTCVNHVWGTCVGGTGPTDQSECDGKDHNCDGVIDTSGCECAPGQTETCGGPDVGQCKSGTRTCGADGKWGDCIGAIGPSPEMCDGIDNNCDGQVDNPGASSTDDVPHSLCGANQVCQAGHCVPVPVTMPPPGGHNVGGEPAGCACTVESRSGLPIGSLLLALGTVVIVRRGRRR